MRTLVGALCATLAVGLAFVTRRPWLQRLDDAVERWTGVRRPTLEPVARFTTLPGENWGHWTIGALVSLSVLVQRGGSPWRVLVPMALASLLAILAHHAIKGVYLRERPAIALGKGKTEPAYPSGHTTDATAVVLTGAYVLASEGLVAAPLGWAAAVVLALMTGMSRVALGWHWATDVIGGFLAGSAVYAVTSAVYDWLNRQNV